MSRAFITSWDGCPQRYLRGEILVERGSVAAREFAFAEKEWRRLNRWRPLRFMSRARVVFDGTAYAAVVSRVSMHTLKLSVQHIAFLRRLEEVDANLLAVAYLERFETALIDEIESRQHESQAHDPSSPPRQSWWPVPSP
jgi:hypothetical protein